MRRHRVRHAGTACALALLALPAAADVPPLPVLADGVTVRISTRADGGQATGNAPGSGTVEELSISADGRYAVFDTTLNLGLGVCPPGTYLRDLRTGQLEMVSVPAGGCVRDFDRVGSSDSYTSISPNGRYVAFTSSARDLLPGRLLPKYSPTGITTRHVFVRDRLRRRTTLVSVGYDGRPANSSAHAPTISDDGRFVAFESTATNLVRGDTGNPDDDLRTDVFLRDLRSGTTVRVGPNGRAKRNPKMFPSLSGNGRYVVFQWDAEGFLPNPGTGNLLNAASPTQVYVWDRITRTTELVSRNDAGYAADSSTTLGGNTGSKISRDGRWITYASRAMNLTRPTTGFLSYDIHHVYLYDRVTKRTRRISDGLAGEGGNAESRDPCLSGDGRYVSFTSAATNLGAVDVTPGYYTHTPDVGADIYLYEVETKRTRLVSRSTEGVPGDANSIEGCPSDGGRAVVFTSKATTLVPDDTNGVADVFVHTYAPGS